MRHREIRPGIFLGYRLDTLVGRFTVSRGFVAVALTAAVVPTPIGSGPRYRPAATSHRVRAAQPVGALRCSNAAARPVAFHVEIFANRRALLIPSGIGISPKRCVYPLRTADPTGVVLVATDRRYRLGDLFRVWDQRLNSCALLSFRGPVAVFVAGRRIHTDPTTLPLRHHAEIVIEIGGYIPPHASYRFPRGT